MQIQSNISLIRSCPFCGSQTRLVGIEPHPARNNIEIRSYDCRDCQKVSIESSDTDTSGMTAN